MRPPIPTRSADEGGTASVELVAVLPFLVLAILIAVQLAVAGGALWSAAVAARAGARADLVGGNATAAARRALPPSMRPGAEVDAAGPVSVEVQVPALLPGLPRVGVGTSSDLATDGQ